jgi:type I restriction enzyme S subunit
MSLFRNLGEVSDTIMGQAPPGEDCNKLGEGTPFVKAGEFGVDRPVIREWTTKPLKLARRNDVLICVVGATSGKINKGEDCAIGRSVAAIRAKQDMLDINYLYFFLKSFSSRLLEMSQGAAQTVITKDMLYFLQIPLPSLPQQQKIANILDAADALRQNDKALIAKYDELTQALFLDMFGDPVSNPKGWEILKLSQLSDITSSRRIFKDEYVENGIPFYRTKEIVELSKNKKISSELFISIERYNEIKSNNDIPIIGDILLSAVGTIGVMWVVNNNDPFYFKDGNLVWLKMSKSKNINSKYLRMTLEYLIEHEKGNLAQGAAYNALTIDKLKKFDVNIAPIQLQNQFAERVAVIEEQKAIAQKSLEKSESLFNSLLQKAFKGELV